MKKDINFLPSHVVETRKKRKQLFITGLLGILIIGIIAGNIAANYQAARDYRAEIASMEHKISELDTAEKYYEEKQELQQELNRKKSALEDIKERRREITGYLERINSILPEKCYVTYFAVKGDRDFVLEVDTNGPVDLARLQVGLRRLDMFERVKLADVGEVPLVQNGSPVRFELKLKHKPSS